MALRRVYLLLTECPIRLTVLTKEDTDLSYVPRQPRGARAHEPFANRNRVEAIAVLRATDCDDPADRHIVLREGGLALLAVRGRRVERRAVLESACAGRDAVCLPWNARFETIGELQARFVRALPRLAEVMEDRTGCAEVALTIWAPRADTAGDQDNVGAARQVAKIAVDAARFAKGCCATPLHHRRSFPGEVSLAVSLLARRDALPGLSEHTAFAHTLLAPYGLRLSLSEPGPAVSFPWTGLSPEPVDLFAA